MLLFFILIGFLDCCCHHNEVEALRHFCLDIALDVIHILYLFKLVTHFADLISDHVGESELQLELMLVESTENQSQFVIVRLICKT